MSDTHSTTSAQNIEAELARLFHKDEAQTLLIMEIAQFQELMGTLAQVTFPPHSALLVETAELRPSRAENHRDIVSANSRAFRSGAPPWA